MNFPFYFQRNMFWLLPFVVLDLLLKGYALWKAGKNNQVYWFVALFVVNSLGILPGIYLLFFQSKSTLASSAVKGRKKK